MELGIRLWHRDGSRGLCSSGIERGGESRKEAERRAVDLFTSSHAVERFVTIETVSGEVLGEVCSSPAGGPPRATWGGPEAAMPDHLKRANRLVSPDQATEE